MGAMDIRHSSLPETAAQALIDEINPGGFLHAIRPVSGDFYNRQFYLDMRSKEGLDICFVVKLYQGEYDFCVLRARVEYQALSWLHLRHCSAPEPVFLDDSGSVLGGPGLVTRFLLGSPILDPPYPPDLGRQMALTLAGIHANPCDSSALTFLLDKNPEKLWWRRSGNIPAWMAADPDGRSIWDAFSRLLARQEHTPPRLCHADFWNGNVLFLAGNISAVVDWEEAGYGDPGSDVAYCYMDLVLSGLDQDASEFLSAYHAVTGGPVANLTLWKLAAAVRPIFFPTGWIDQSPVRERFREFVRQAIQESNLIDTTRRTNS